MKQAYLKGVNLGGWLIPEPWLTPGLFAKTGSKSLYDLLESKQGREAYRRHIATFIQENDWAWIAEHGIKLVRLPVGYWDFDQDTAYVSTLDRIDWAMAMAEKYGLKVLIDLHAARGSQNGHGHSGRAGEAKWWQSDKYQAKTIETLAKIAQRYRRFPSLWGIELLNEPRITARRYFPLLKFYRSAYARLLEVARPGVYIVFHDAFHPLLLAGAIRARNTNPVVMDTHWYGIPTKYVKSLRLSTYLELQRHIISTVLWLSSLRQPVIIGEWSAVAPEDYMKRADRKQFAAIWRANGMAQQVIYEQRSLASIYWTYKGEGPGVWHLRSLVEDKTLDI